MVDPETLRRVQNSAQDFVAETALEVWIISGHRTLKQQKELGRRGRPVAPPELSTHLTCPATGVDVSFGTLPTRVMKAIWGRIAVMNGLRWGGGSDVDDGGLPLDWQHVDRGPR